MQDKLWKFSDNLGSFESGCADKIKSLYFALANESLMSSVSADLHGDIKSGPNSFLLTPVSRIDLVNLRSSRNFWIYIDKNKIWSATGVSKDLKQIENDRFSLKAGLLWHKISRENKKIGLKAEILSFIPASNEPVEVMQVKITNISGRKIKFIPAAAIPIYGRGANNIRDHRHVTSLLQRIKIHKFGVICKPTLSFDETGHRPNKDNYFVLGWDERFTPPEYLYPTQEMFCQEDGDLEAPKSVLENKLPQEAQIQGREAMGALRFRHITLGARQSFTYIILLGITQSDSQIKTIIHKFNSLKKIKDSFQQTKDFWITRSQQISLETGNSDFDNWFRWVSIQPVLRKIFGCSFLPDFDYGKGGRGWRDLWQDCLGLLFTNPAQVRRILINNFSGVRIDGSNATIIGKRQGEFISDRNNISRVWMDHGIWPLLTLDLYLHETGDFKILFEKTSYFRDRQIFRSRDYDLSWNPACGQILETSSGKIYKGTILEHLLVQSLVQFFNVGSHNHIRLEGADWNDGLDMAQEKGQSVAFSAMYAHNLKALSRLLLKTGKEKVEIAAELKIFFSKINYSDIKRKQKILSEYFSRIKSSVSGNKISIDVQTLAHDLKMKSEWMMQHIRKSEWQKDGFFNGYYDNLGRRVEGKIGGFLRMILSSQVFPIMSGTAQDWQIEEILKSTHKYLLDKELGGFHLNTDFKEEQHNLGRAFSFVYGDKENGAFFNHMSVMFAYALYERGFVKQGWGVLKSIYDMAINTGDSKIYPCLPEYFNLEGRGMYSYLTGSASWFVLTMLAQVFGVKGQNGNLLIEPKLTREQFRYSTNIAISRTFAGRKFYINFSNPKKLDYGKYKMTKVRFNSYSLTLTHKSSLVIPRKIISNLSKQKVNVLDIELS